MLLSVVAALVVGVYVYTQLDREIQQYVERKLRSHYQGLKVEVASAQLIEGRGIEIRGITLAEPDSAGGRKLLRVDEIFVVGSPTLSELLQDRFQVERIIVRRPRLIAAREPDNRWNVRRLVPLPKFGDGRPTIVIENAAVELHDTLVTPHRKLTLRDGDFQLQPEPSRPGEPSGPRRFALQGALRGDFVQRIQVAGRFSTARPQWQLSGTAEGVELGPELLAALPAHLVEGSEPIRALRGKAAIRFELANDPSGEQPCLYRTVCQLARGRIDDPRLPYPLIDVDAYVRCENGLLSIDRLTASHGQMQLSLTCQRKGYAADAPMTLSAKLRKLQLNRQFANGLPDQYRRLWHEYLPEGEVDLDLRLVYDGQRWRPDLVVQCENVGLTYHKFPYHLQRSSGTLTYRNDTLQIDLKAHADDHPVRILGEVFHPGPQATGWVELRGSDIALDERLVAALPAQGRRVLAELNPQGRFQFYWRSSRDEPHARLQSRLQVTLDRCAIRFSKFPYPLTNIRGQVEMQNDHWRFRNLEGTNDTGFVTCNGELAPTPQGPRLSLQFAGTEVPLEEELRNALNPAARQLWNDLRPQGRVDLTAEVTYLFASRQLGLRARFKPVAEITSIEPVAFPYRMEKLRGVVQYHDGYVTLHDMRAEHGSTRIATDGHCQMQPNGSWYLTLENLTIDRLAADRELLIALPPGMRSVVSKLNLSGPIYARGSLGLAQDAIRGAPLKSQWDLAFDLHRNAVDVGVELTDVHGEVKLAGNFDGERFQSRGELAIDSLNYGDLQFTQVRGPLWIDNERVLLGIWAQKQTADPMQRRITAQLYGGEVAGDGWVTLAEPQRFAMQASLRGAELARFATEGIPGQQDLRGKMAGDLELRGSGSGTHWLAGSGNVRLRQADIYELPLVVQLLKVFRVRLPDKTAFTQSDMVFRIDGQHVYFDKLDLLGDALSLYGKGEMNLNREIQLTFHSVVGRNDLPVPVLRNLVGEASQQLMQVHVHGTLENPQIINEPFPVVNQALQQLEAGLSAPPSQPAISMDPRNWLRPATPVAPQRR